MSLHSFSAIFCFFFSSRRRHTRFDCDWSSDVCSSDLHMADGSADLSHVLAVAEALGQNLQQPALIVVKRSEERRVGKDSRSSSKPTLNLNGNGNNFYLDDILIPSGPLANMHRLAITHS